MAVLNWICFIPVCIDVVVYIAIKARDEKCKDFASLIGVLIGIAARVYVLFNTATHWLLV